MEEHGTHLLTVIAPSKEFIYPDYLPSSYRGIYTTQNNYTEFVAGCKENGVPLIDFCRYFKNFRNTSKYPVFTKTGLHWSIYAASVAQDSLINYMEHILSKSFPKYKDIGLEVSDTARISDDDFELPLNLLFSINASPYFYRKREIIKSSEKNYRPKVIIIGDSFFGVLKQQEELRNIFAENSRYWYYFQESDPFSDRLSVSMQNEDVLEELESADFVVLFGNIGTLDKFPYGITDYYCKNFTNPRKETFGPKIFCRFKAANRKFLCADAGCNDLVVADRDAASYWETFSLVHLTDNQYAIYSFKHKYFTAATSGNGIIASGDSITPLEKFTMFRIDDSLVAFRAASGKYLSVDEKSNQLFAKSDGIGKQEKFEIIIK